MNIDSIQNGVVIDHIEAGSAMKLYDLLGLDSIDVSVAIIKNVQSKKMGKKDIIKIDASMDINFDALGYLDPDVTINIIENGIRVKKIHPELPEKITNIVKCRNPRCITSTEQEIKHIFKLTDRKKRVYRCLYCDTAAKR